ncbi:chromate transporter [Paenibacillus sp. J5C_2022]|nr:chromate transporter [Paenibacillus sp. J5C2022]
MHTTTKKPSFFSILWSFLKLSPISFGGGYAIFPSIEREVVDRRRWLSGQELSETLSLASAAPGGVGVNAAILLGHRLNGVSGAVAAGIGAILPTFFIVLAVFFAYMRFGDSPKVRGALSGVTWGVITLILFSALRMGRTAIKDKFTLLLMLGGLICLFAGLSPVYLIVAGIVISIVATLFKQRNENKREASRTVEEGYMYFI